jgi:hypothetical protein
VDSPAAQVNQLAAQVVSKSGFGCRAPLSFRPGDANWLPPNRRDADCDVDRYKDNNWPGIHPRSG